MMAVEFTYKDGDYETMRAKLDAEHKRLQDLAADRRERCVDDDCWLSEWAEGIHLRALQTAVDLAEDEWRDRFLCLSTLDGKLVDAKQIETQYGTRWFIPEPPEGCAKFAPYLPKRAKTLHKYGYKEAYYWRDAMVVTMSTGHGLSGNVWVTTDVDRWSERDRGTGPVYDSDREDLE